VKERVELREVLGTRRVDRDCSEFRPFIRCEQIGGDLLAALRDAVASRR